MCSMVLYVCCSTVSDYPRTRCLLRHLYPVVMRSAFGTILFTNSKIFRFRIFVAADIAGFGARKEFVHLNKRFIHFFKLILQKCHKPPPTVIDSGICQNSDSVSLLSFQDFLIYTIINIGYLP